MPTLFFEGKTIYYKSMKPLSLLLGLIASSSIPPSRHPNSNPSARRAHEKAKDSGCLLENPGITILLDVDRALLIQAYTACVQDGSREDCVLDGREALRVVELRGSNLPIHVASSVDKLLDRDVAVASLTVKVTRCGG